VPQVMNDYSMILETELGIQLETENLIHLVLVRLGLLLLLVIQVVVAAPL